MLFSVKAEQAPIRPETIFNIGSLDITNAMILGVIITIGFTFFSLYIRKRRKLVPSKFQTILEITVQSFLNLLEQIAGSKKAARTLLPLVGTIFLFFGVSNLIGLIPGVTAFTYNGAPLLRTPTNDFNMTFSIALAMIILTQVVSIKEFGLFGHLGKFIKVKEVIVGFRHGFKSGIMSIVDFVLGLLDIISEIAKVFSLSLRLFGNMYAGEVLMVVLLGAFAVAVPSIWLAMNLLVGVLQAMVFGALTAAYYGLAVQKME